jgi:hypothetical protein
MFKDTLKSKGDETDGDDKLQYHKVSIHQKSQTNKKA